MFQEAQRLKKLPAYVFAQLDHLKEVLRKKGVDIIDLGMGNPDPAAPQPVVDELFKALQDPQNHRYSSFEGYATFGKAVAAWCKKQYGITVNPDKEVIPLIGSKEGLVHFSFAFLDPGDTAILPLPAYPAHFRGPILAGAQIYTMPLSAKTDYVPDFSIIDPDLADQAKLLILSYPTNPTAATAPKRTFQEAVRFCKKHNLILLHDFAYAELYYDDYRPVSALSVKGAKEVTIEFHTFSKTFSMAGWRVGFAVGNAFLIETLKKIKTNLDYGLFPAVQKAAVRALTLPQSYIRETRELYRRRRDLFMEGIRKLGWEIPTPKATMYIWLPVPKGYNANSFAMMLAEKTGVIVAPGTAFGDLGEGYVRVALVERRVRLKEALRRMERAGIRYAV